VSSEPHLLIVDDSPLVTDALRILFEETGHRVSTAGSVREAVDICGADRPDVMLLDLTLPDGSGLDVLAALGGSPPATLALTGHDDPRTTARCLAAGCREVLLKPVPTRQLLDKVRAAAGIA
jgi:DNA-binding response OmpR family regulator